MGMSFEPQGGLESFRGIDIHWGYGSSNDIAMAIGLPPFASDDKCFGSMPTHDLLVACAEYLRTSHPEYVFPSSLDDFKPSISIGRLSEKDTVRRVKSLYEMCAAALWQGHHTIVWG